MLIVPNSKLNDSDWQTLGQLNNCMAPDPHWTQAYKHKHEDNRLKKWDAVKCLK
jgi:hypothetical protein